MDWADRIADILEYGGEERDTVSSVAQELRKAKADGYRNGAVRWNECGCSGCLAQIEEIAAEIEKGN